MLYRSDGRLPVKGDVRVGRVVTSDTTPSCRMTAEASR